MKKLLLLSALLVLTGVAAGQVQHSVIADEDSARINTTIQLECSGGNCPVNSWQLTWTVPEGAEITSIEDSFGEIEDYTRTGDQLIIETNQGPARKTETIRVSMLLEKDAEKVYSGLYKRSFSLPGIEGKETTGTLKTENLLSGWTGHGFNASFTGEEMKFRGTGSANLRVKFGEGKETSYFSFFGEKPAGTEEAYTIPVGMTGLVQNFKRFPVAVMPDSVYDRKLNSWSAGEYVSGAIQIREPSSIEEDFLPVLAHEVVHGLNDRELNWDATRSSYFDEGSSKYVEFLYRKKLYSQGETDKPPRELFGEPVRYDPNPGDRRYYRLESKGDADRLWQYYQEDRDFMKKWSAMSSLPENRDFGYAYSELVIRNYVANMNGSLKEVYGKINVDRKVEDPEVKWSIYSQYMDMTPCEYNSREKFDACLERVNEYDYRVYSAEPLRTNETLEFEQLEIPERKTSSQDPGAMLNRFFNSFLKQLSRLFEDAVLFLEQV